MKYVKELLGLFIVFTAVAGDFVVFKSTSGFQTFRAFADSLVHATIGLLSAITFFTYDNQISREAACYNVLFCTFISSFIDIDHVLLAKSFKIKDITSLPNRGFLHCTSLWILICLLFFSYSFYIRKLNLYFLSWMFVIAFTSHHIRDSNRRGIWFYPFGSTPALPNYLYILLTLILPHVFGVLCRSMKGYFSKDVVVRYSIV